MRYPDLESLEFAFPGSILIAFSGCLTLKALIYQLSSKRTMPSVSLGKCITAD